MSMYDRVLAITGVIPPFVLLWLAERFERRIKEPTHGWRYRVMAASGMASIPIAWAERLLSKAIEPMPRLQAAVLDSFVVSATIEELGKLTCLVLFTRGTLAPRTRYAAFLYALHAAMGFALVENVLAMLKTPDLIAFSSRFFLRAYMTVPMHLVAGGTFGYVWARARFDQRAAGAGLGLLLAIGLHGGFNTSLALIDALPSEQDPIRFTLAGVAMAIPLLGVAILRVLAGQLRSLDQRDDAAAGRRPAS
jgi:RsiW-degrading membrane proteinase PrsW (M82 family)